MVINIEFTPLSQTATFYPFKKGFLKEEKYIKKEIIIKVDVLYISRSWWIFCNYIIICYAHNKGPRQLLELGGVDTTLFYIDDVKISFHSIYYIVC